MEVRGLRELAGLATGENDVRTSTGICGSDGEE
jgi:hypothetical protein